MAAATVLCGAATAACGPIVFVGLMVPHVVRSFTGPDLRWILPYATVLSPVLLLGADVIGRIVARPAELQVGIVTAVLGGPVFIYLVRRRRTAAAVTTSTRSGHAAPRPSASGAPEPFGRRRAVGPVRRPGVHRRRPAAGRRARRERRADRHRRLPDLGRATCSRRCSATATAVQEFIVNDLRLPRVLVGLLVGASLGLGGRALPVHLPQSAGQSGRARPRPGLDGRRAHHDRAVLGERVPGRARGARRRSGDRARHLSARLEARRARLPAGSGRHRRLRDRHGGQRLSADQGRHRRRGPRGGLDDRLARRP